MGIFVGEFKKRYSLYLILSVILIIIFNLIGYSIFPNHEEGLNEEAIKVLTDDSILLTTFHAVIVAPIAEELIFRGGIIGLLFKNKKWLGLIVSVVSFTLVNAPNNLQTAWPYLVMGIVFS